MIHNKEPNNININYNSGAVTVIPKVNCPLCKSNDASKFLAVKSDFIDIRFNLVRCNRCSLIFVNNKPVLKEVIKLYNKMDYRSLGSFEYAYSYPIFRNIVREVTRLKNAKRILDIGCGKGEFIVEMEKRGWDVYGIDVSSYVCKLAERKLKKKNKIYNCELSDCDFHNDYFDVITLWTVLEHVYDPDTLLGEIYDILKDEGILIIQVPNIENLIFKFTKEKYSALQTVPLHVNFFTPETLEAIITKNGFKVIRRLSTRLIFPSNLFKSFKSSLIEKPSFLKLIVFFNLLLFLLPSTILHFFQICIPFLGGEDLRFYSIKTK